MPAVDNSPDRRTVFRVVASLGIGSAVFQKALASEIAQPAKALKSKNATITPEMIENAEWVAGITLTEAQRKQVATSLSRMFANISQVRQQPLPNDIPPAFHFHPAPDSPASPVESTPFRLPDGPVEKPDSSDELAFLSVSQLGRLLRRKAVSSVELTRMYLDRLQKYDPALLCVVSLTEEVAMKQARQADEELAAGKIRGPLHGIPWGAKDLIAIPGYKTTWGAAEYKEQTLTTKATVAQRLEEAGAVLVAKLTLGALAMGDQWFGGMTRNPWNVKQGSSGSSAGSASAVAAGLVGFAIGSETLGSIVSPSTRCGVSGLRPTFGRVSRAGCMTLAWSMDKLGPMCRSAEDCALVLDAIHGADPLDPAAVDRPFSWPITTPLKELRVGYVESKNKDSEAEYLKVLRELGCQLVPITLPTQQAGRIVSIILDAECGSAFDDLTQSGKLDGIGRNWPTTFLESRFISAVDYLRANRIRTQIMREMATVMEKVDLYVAWNDLVLTNLTGHPTMCMPGGFTKNGTIETPRAITFTGRLYGESQLLTVARAYQEATGYHLKKPPMDRVTKENAGL